MSGATGQSQRLLRLVRPGTVSAQPTGQGTIGKIHQDNKQAYGGLKIWKAMNQAGMGCGKHRVARLRGAAGIEALRKRKF